MNIYQGGEVFRPAIADWSDLDRLGLPDFDNPSYYDGARQLAASDTTQFRIDWMSGWPFATCRYLRKMYSQNSVLKA